MFRYYFITVMSFIFIWGLVSIANYIIDAHNKNNDEFIEIRTCEDLSNIRNNLDGKYILMNDIDCGGEL